MASLKDITKFINEYLSVNDIDDISYNGLQVENKGEVKKICFAVDADITTFKKAKDEGCNMIITHHGIAWKYTKPIISGLLYKKIKFLIENDIALYAVHLPLDINENVGNNIVLARMLGISETKPFGDYHGILVGLIGKTDISVEKLRDDVQKLLEAPYVSLHQFGSLKVKKLAIVTGSGGFALDDAEKEGFDTLLTGEVEHRHVIDAREKGINIIEAGHYFTETTGIKALVKVIEKQFNIDCVFVNTF